jgi:all-trans-nonaprenyl-diphosphate synthase
MKTLGMVLQVVDDILDFTQTEEQLGKPRFQDIASGNLTAPTLFAMKKSPELVQLIEGEFMSQDGALELAVELIEQHGGASHLLSHCSSPTSLLL